ncbi:MAG: hypothetical protein IPH58_19300 [Sphingobacteriales bacterium]|jgi:hypothetical protein|nr:hypothetical protein [Sphingobacteriales bacterium]
MKTLKAYLVVAASADTSLLKKLEMENKGVTFQFEHIIETAIDHFNRQHFDLLILDKAIPVSDYNKLQKLAELLHPDAAVIAFHLMDEEYIRIKFKELKSNWADAQTDTQTHFIDNPSL